ncbi:histidinol phosphate aminotransferase apoenzyme [Candidatus Ruthia magnifica str. Cm (Calyptogena magnifica)]|uniref:Histidinol-phosphate aminotransferase n=1 Tax=Ruthia magnifica subsp. Calyptogena magnifica TaxID=413404 RepID=A1AXK5_RUTMC|nr:histidinol-phosphate transaminase [Candidatus Ruthturnera calyptogenae]ABL02662.1 histidinol phosphate aminotransferase apoenzyme [Candidatus Ruthia magnifica str. Cm (Calyptogena magnifica)]
MSFINNWLRPDIKAINVYHVPFSNDMVKLDAMESPFSLSNTLIGQYLADIQLNRYPASASANELQQTLRELMDIPDEFGVLLGNGSDELIQLLALACDAGDTILSVDPSFVMYGMIAKFTRLNYLSVALTNDFEIDADAMQRVIETHSPKLIFIAYPNNPTGNAFDRTVIEKIITSSNALVVLDEAYYAYANDSFLLDIKKYPNLVLLRTVSKIGFAGLRLGLLIAAQDMVAALDKLRLPYNINTLTQVSANFLLKEKKEINQNSQIILKERIKLSSTLGAISGLQVYPSQANFILFKTQNANLLFKFLKVNGVLIKDLSSIPALTDCLRATIGTQTQNQTFINLVKRFYDWE